MRDGNPRGQTTAVADLFGKSNLVAWCIVPFDSVKRGPEQRAEMVQKLGVIWRPARRPFLGR
jgi:hypothetical protein